MVGFRNWITDANLFFSLTYFIKKKHSLKHFSSRLNLHLCFNFGCFASGVKSGLLRWSQILCELHQQRDNNVQDICFSPHFDGTAGVIHGLWIILLTWKTDANISLRRTFYVKQSRDPTDPNLPVCGSTDTLLLIPQLWSRWKHLNKFRIVHHDIWYIYSYSPSGGFWVWISSSNYIVPNLTMVSMLT